MCIFTLARHLPRALGCVLAGFSARLRPGTGPRHGAQTRGNDIYVSDIWQERIAPEA